MQFASDLKKEGFVALHTKKTVTGVATNGGHGGVERRREVPPKSGGVAIGVEHCGEIVQVVFLGQAPAHHGFDPLCKIVGRECAGVHAGSAQRTRDECGTAGIDAVDVRKGAGVVGPIGKRTERGTRTVLPVALRHKRAGGHIAPTAVQLRAEHEQQARAETAEHVDPQQEIAQQQGPNGGSAAVDLHDTKPQTELAERAPVEDHFLDGGEQQQHQHGHR